MSFWEGSASQAAAEAKQKALAAIEKRVATSNPSLSPSDVREWAKREYEQQHPAPAPKCCACRGRVREVVRVGEYLGPCRCECHK